MIIQILFAMFFAVATLLTAWLPPATVLPFGTDQYVAQGFNGLRALIVVYQPLGVVLHAFILYLGFRLTLIILKILFGHRAPNVN